MVELKLNGNKVDVAITELNQPVQTQGPNGQISQIKGMARDTTTKFSITKEEAILNRLQFEKRKAEVMENYESELARINAQIKIFQDAEALFV